MRCRSFAGFGLGLDHAGFDLLVLVLVWLVLIGPAG
jgi:hypothetical protein